MNETITWVGIDAHKKTLQVAFRSDGVWTDWSIPHTKRGIKSLRKKLMRVSAGEIRCCYEAGPLGYALQRSLQAEGPLVCEVIAPSLIPTKSGDRVKTDRRDARKLAEYLQADLLTEVRAPNEEQEAARDLTRCRLAVKADVLRARHRLSKFLLRRGIRYTAGKKAWTTTYHKWLNGLKFENQTDQVVFDHYWLGIQQRLAEIDSIESELKRLSEVEPYCSQVGWLRCFRGIDTVSAMTLLCEIHDFSRFRSPLQLMSYLGLTPSEHSSGEKRNRGPITKSGNKHARKILVETSWHYRHSPSVGVGLAKRREGQPTWAITIADKAQMRLCGRYRRLTNRGKPNQKAVVAVARELVGFIWAAMRQGQQLAA